MSNTMMRPAGFMLDIVAQNWNQSKNLNHQMKYD
jgi:hypothetical protein